MVWISKSVNSDQNGSTDLPLTLSSILLSVFPPGLTGASLPVTQEERKKTKEFVSTRMCFDYETPHEVYYTELHDSDTRDQRVFFA